MTAMKIVSYDRNTKGIAAEVRVPADAEGAARLIANVPASDPDLVAAYPLTRDQVRQIVAVAQIAIDPRGFDYFLEAEP